MRVLFRVPLFDFDPKNEFEIEDNWKEILEAISVSSKSLYHELIGTTYSKLNPYIKKKVLKYILRGRYRATPFGRFAAVGIGDFLDSSKQQLDLRMTISLNHQSDKPIPEIQSIEPTYFVNNSFDKWGKLQILSYILNDQRWGIVEIPKTEILELLIKNLNVDSNITYDKFLDWFEDRSDDSVKQLWEKLLELGIIHSEQQIISQIRSRTKVKIDQVVKDSLSLPKMILNEIKDFELTAGKLFSQKVSSYLESLRRWFEEKFDDRFVPLSLLLVDHEFLTGSFLSRDNFEKDREMPSMLPENVWQSEQVDLKNFFNSQPLNSEIFDVQLVFKLLGSNSIQLENIVCNRPFVYFGRFNRDDSIYQEQEKIKEQIFQNQDVIYAELRFFETELVDSICMSKQLFSKYITPIPDNCPNAIPLRDIEIGLIGDRFLLVHSILHKTIIPVVANPLNGREISHPVMRLLWELDHQIQFPFFPYDLSRRIDCSYIPRMVWGNIILQSRKWIVRSTSFSTEMDLKMWLEKSKLPSPLTAGYLDRELLLDWQNELELSILWSELKKWGKINLIEPEWYGKSEFISKKGRPIYPQFIARISKPKFEPIFHRLINSIEHCDPDCLYILIRVHEENILEALTSWFDKTILSYLLSEKIKWYYLVYPYQNHYQIRIRFLNLTEAQRTSLSNLIIPKSADGFQSIEIRPYYPEIKKYGKSAYKKSEKLFHLESSLLMNPIDNEDLRIIECSSSLKAALLTELWESTLVGHSLMDSIYKYSRTRVKSLSHTELKSIKMIWQESIFTGPLKEYQRNWIKDYSSTLLDHSSLQESEESGLRLIKNHIHMQVNRFFLNERKEYEEMIHFHLYKRFGRLIHGS